MHYFSYKENKQHGTPDFPAEYFYVDEKHTHYNMPFHWHKEWEIIHILKGEMSLFVNGEEYCTKEGDILLLREGVLHGGTPKNCVYECFNFYFHGLFANVTSVKDYLRPFYRHELLPFTYYKNSCEIYPVVDEIFSAFKQGKSECYCRLETLSNIGRLFALIYENHYYTENDETTTGISPKVEQLKPVLEYIEENYANPLSLTELSRVIGMNAKYFCRFFSSTTQQTPMNYVNYYRVEQAANLLSRTDKPVTEIGLECGFNDVCHFIKTFKKYKGVTPKQFQKRNS